MVLPAELREAVLLVGVASVGTMVLDAAVVFHNLVDQAVLDTEKAEMRVEVVDILATV